VNALTKYRAEHHEYADVGDVKLATALHRKYYASMPVGDFYKAVGLTETIDPTEGMSGLGKFAAGYGKATVDAGRGIAQALTPDDSEFGRNLQASIDESQQRDKPLMNTGAGAAGNLVNSIAMAAPTAAIPGANTALGAAAIGGVTGALQPTASNESTIDKAGTGALFGVGGQIAGRMLPSVIKAIVAPFYSGGRERLAADVIERFATNIDDVTNKAGTASGVPGVQYSLAEATQDPGMAILQRGAEMLDPKIAGGMAQQKAGNIVAARTAVEGIAGDEAKIAAATALRKQTATPLYEAVKKSDALVDPSRVVGLIDRMTTANPGNRALVAPLKEIRETLFESYPVEQRGADAWKVVNDALQGRNFSAPGSTEIKAVRTVLDRVKKGAISVDDALAEIKGIKPKKQAFIDAVDSARQYLKTPDYVVRQNPQQVKSSIDNVKALLGNQDNAFVKRELTTIKKALDHQLSKAVPEYGQAEKIFAQLSKPINQMQIGRELYNKMTPALADGVDTVMARTRAEQFANALREGDQTAKNATGFKGATLANTLDPSQSQTLQDVKNFLARRANVDDMGRGAGSNTAQNLASGNLMRQIIGPLGLPESWADSVVSQTLRKGVDVLAKPADAAIQEVLVDALMNPQKAAALLQKMAPTQRQQMIRALYSGALPAVSVGSGAYAAGQ